MSDTSEIVILIRKKIDGTISTDELLLLESWANRHPSNSNLLDRLVDEDLILEDALNWLEFRREIEGGWRERFASMTLAKIESPIKSDLPSKPKIYVRLLPYVAAMLILAMFGVIYFDGQSVEEVSVSIEDLDPGRNRARIVFSDGHIIDLREDQKGIVLGEDLTYQDGSYISKLSDEQIKYAELKTPRGGQYQITLVDGTKVWLNAESKLTYPSRFDDGSRIVELEGEAYFEVTPFELNQKNVPFIVKTAKQDVKVLGTQFNVKAYANDADVKTTLVEGAVQIHAAGTSLFLKPGEQGVSNADQVSKSKVEVDQYIAWKKNKFIFYETELKEAMKTLSRWYDFETLYEDSVEGKHFYGTISRDKGLAEVLKIMEAGGLKFTIERLSGQNRLTVLKPN